MKKNKSKSKPAKISIALTLEYGPVEMVEQTRGDYVLHLSNINHDVNAGKNLEKASLSLKCEIPIEGKTPNYLTGVCHGLRNNDFLNRYIYKAVIIQEFMEENYRNSHGGIATEFPDLSVNWLDNAVFHNSYLYFFGITAKKIADSASGERVFLDFIRDMIETEPSEDEALKIDFTLNLHFRSWSYLLTNRTPAIKQSYKEFIKHRENQLRKFMLQNI